MSSSASFLKIVVFPALSRPSTRILASLSVRFNLRSKVSNPILFRFLIFKFLVAGGPARISSLGWPERPGPTAAAPMQNPSRNLNLKLPSHWHRLGSVEPGSLRVRDARSLTFCRSDGSSGGTRPGPERRRRLGH